MTSQEFRSEYGAEWAKLVRKPIIRALFETMRRESPLEKAPNTAGPDIVVGGAVLFAECKGWIGGIQFMENLAEKPDGLATLESSYKDE